MRILIESTLAYDAETDTLTFALRNTSDRPLTIRRPDPFDDLLVLPTRGGDKVPWRYFGLRVPQGVTLQPGEVLSDQLELFQHFVPDSAG